MNCAGVVVGDISVDVTGSKIEILSQNATRLTFQITLGADAVSLGVDVSYGLTCDSAEKFSVHGDFALVVIQTVDLDFDNVGKTRSFKLPAIKCLPKNAVFESGNVSGFTCTAGVCTFGDSYSIVALQSTSSASKVY